VSTLAENVTRWLGRVELLARGVDERRRAAVLCLEGGDPFGAREHALALLVEVPRSPVGLAILAEACEALGLDDEVVGALRSLCASAPWRGELWVRLAEALMRVGAPAAEVAKVLENAVGSDTEPLARRRALLLLFDIDLRAGDVWRATHWLDALRFQASEPDVVLRRIEVALLVGDRVELASLIDGMGEPAVLDGRGALALGRTRWMLGRPGALDLLLRAFLLEAGGAKEALASFLASSRDVVEVKRIKDVLDASGEVGDPSFAVALALSEGREEDARRALAVIARAGDTEAARSLLGIALDRKDVGALAAAVDVLGDASPRDGVVVLHAHRAVQDGRFEDALVVLDEATVDGTSAGAMAHELRAKAFSGWLDRGGEDAFRSVLAELRRAAGVLDRLDLIAACEALVVEQRTPLRVAVVGEFNAGKSTFINALLGADVAPTGILPTTSSLHFLRWAQDPFVRIVAMDGADRIVPHEGLKAALRDLQVASVVVREVHICAPIERLRLIEVLDTPGFNAPDMDHIAAASRAVREAHVALWVLDGTQALKDSERTVLARIADIGTPVQVIVNKRDRIDPARVDAVMSHVRDGIASVGLASMADVVCFSARRALEGRLGDLDAARSSCWDDVEAVVSSAIVNRSGVLRERALRRKARCIAEELAVDHEMKLRATRQEDPTQDLVSSALRLLNLDRSQCERVVARWDAPSTTLRDDLRPLHVAGVGGADVNALAFADARLLARMTEPTVRALSDVAGVPAPLESLVREAVLPVLRGASASMRTLDGIGDLLCWRVVRACAVASYDRMMTAHADATVANRVDPQWLRLRALVEALRAGQMESESKESRANTRSQACAVIV